METDELPDKAFISRNVEETRTIARDLVKGLPPRVLLALHGELGSGKTSFVQGIALALGIKEMVTSPSFTIINEYKAERPLYHVDLYRLHNPDEILALGIEDYLYADGITAIEWAERAGDLLPEDAVDVYFKALPRPNERRIAISAMPPNREATGN